MKAFKDTKIIVTGGNGFIGKHLVRSLLDSGADVFVIDSCCTGWSNNNDYARERNRTCVCLNADLTTTSIAHVIEHTHKFIPDYIFHLAADVGGIEYLLGNEHKVFLNNARINLNALNGLENKKFSGLKGFLFMSSACIYPKQGGSNIKETDAIPANPHSSYGWSKFFGEQLVTCSPIPAAIVRMSNVYGPGDHLGKNSHVIPALCQKIFQASPSFEVFGSGEQARAFVYVDDAIDAMKRAIITSSIDTPVYNVGGPDITIKNVVDLIYKASKRKGLEVIWNTTKPEGEKHRELNCDKIKNDLNWVPQVGIKEGLKKTYKSVKDQITRIGTFNSPC